jgi:hypothetical protein
MLMLDEIELRTQGYEDALEIPFGEVEWIAKAREDIFALVAYVRYLERQLANMTASRDWWQEGCAKRWDLRRQRV